MVLMVELGAVVVVICMVLDGGGSIMRVMEEDF